MCFIIYCQQSGIWFVKYLSVQLVYARLHVYSGNECLSYRNITILYMLKFRGLLPQVFLIPYLLFLGSHYAALSKYLEASKNPMRTICWPLEILYPSLTWSWMGQCTKIYIIISKPSMFTSYLRQILAK